MEIMEKQKPQCGFYRHFKGGCYEVIGIAKHSETLEEMVVYRACYDEGTLWVRPIAMWNEEVDVLGERVPRFTWIGADASVL